MFITPAQTTEKVYSRIVSLVPSQTELLADLGLEAEVVGLTKFCVHPDRWFRKKERVGGTKNIDLEKVRRLNPDLIIANREENQKEQIEELAADFDIWVTDVGSLSDALEMINGMGTLTGCARRAREMSQAISDRFEILKRAVRPARKRALYLIWKDPWMAAASHTFINDMMERAGYSNVLQNQERYPVVDLAGMTGKVELILLSSEPYPFRQVHCQELRRRFPGLQIELVDGEMFSWYGSRLLKSVDYFLSISGNQ